MRYGYAILGSFQLMIIFICVPILRFVLKAWGYPDDLGVSWNPVSVLLGRYGLFLMVFPVVWFSCALIVRSRNRNPRTNWIVWASGIGLFVFLFGMFLYGALDPFTRKILLAPG